MYANADAESGSDVGSDFAMYRANDAGSETRVMYIQRSTGNVTFDNAVSAASLTATGTNGVTVNGGLTYLQPGSNASNALWIRGKASQGSSLVLFQNDSGTTLSSIGADGSFNGPAALSGTPTATTAAVDTNTTQIATTAYVIGQGYLKSATASSTYAPLASPTFTGTVTTPGVKRNVVTKTALYTLTASDHIVIATSGTWTASLPTAASIAGTEYIIKNSGSGIITVDPAGTETIDGSTTIDLAQYDSLTVVSDGTNWVIV